MNARVAQKIVDRVQSGDTLIPLTRLKEAMQVLGLTTLAAGDITLTLSEVAG